MNDVVIRFVSQLQRDARARLSRQGGHEAAQIDVDDDHAEELPIGGAHAGHGAHGGGVRLGDAAEVLIERQV